MTHFQNVSDRRRRAPLKLYQTLAVQGGENCGERLGVSFTHFLEEESQSSDPDDNHRGLRYKNIKV
jgi:hypothetical protein